MGSRGKFASNMVNQKCACNGTRTATSNDNLGRYVQRPVQFPHKAESFSIMTGLHPKSLPNNAPLPTTSP